MVKRVLLLGQEEEGLSYLAEALGSAELVCSSVRMSEVSDDIAFTEADVVVIDAPLVDREVLAMCRRLRGILSVPIVVCSLSGEEPDVIQSFDSGVDDYLVLPMRPAEMSARIIAMLRRTTRSDRSALGPSVVRGDLEIDMENKRVVRGGGVVDLSPTEFRLLAALVRGSGRAVSHTKLLAAVWGPEYVDSRNYLRLYIAYLRTKLESDPREPRLILNEWGVGYRLNL